MKKIKEYTFVIALAVIVAMFIGCASYVAVETSTARRCSICEGRGFVTEIDTRFLPNVVYVNVLCKWCNGRGIVRDPYYYLESGRIVYNYPYYPRRHMVRPRPHHPTPAPRPNHRIDSGHNKGIPSKQPTPHNRGGRR
jgi:hypothetical protein